MIDGRIKRWNYDEGIGIITSAEVDEDIFVNFADFKHKDLTPSVGDDVRFKLKKTKKGLYAKKVFYPNRPKQLLITTATAHPRDQMRTTSTKIFSALIVLTLLAFVAFFGYKAWQKYQFEKLSTPVYSTKPKK